MAHINQKRPNTRLQIIQLAAHLFIENGYSNTTAKQLARELDLSPGNITFYFPTKEHMLAVLVKELFDFQKLIMEQAAAEGKSSLLAYCLELTAIVSACEESEVARDFYTAAYTSELSLAMIRENDTQKTREVFAEYRPDWDEAEWIATENIVSGIEYATIMTREQDTPLETQIRKTLNAIMLLYGVPEEVRKTKIQKVLATDYRALGRRILREFREYIDKVNQENLKKATKREG